MVGFPPWHSIRRESHRIIVVTYFPPFESLHDVGIMLKNVECGYRDLNPSRKLSSRPPLLLNSPWCSYTRGSFARQKKGSWEASILTRLDHSRINLNENERQFEILTFLVGLHWKFGQA